MDSINVNFEKSPCDPALFESLGDYYRQSNVNKAYLCYETALFYCVNPSGEDTLEQKMENCTKDGAFCVNPVSIVILSYNSRDITIECINSIRRNNPAGSYELVVVDNDSSDGIREWLKDQSDITLILNDSNMGFACGCNQGAKAAARANDVFFLNNDTIVCENSIFWLRMGLYESDDIGAVGSISNDAGNYQKVQKEFGTVAEWLDFGKHNNIFMENPYEEKLFLIGFAMMVKRRVLDEVGLFDLAFGIGNYEDNDLGMRILDGGYRLLLCNNSFIFHYGKMGFAQKLSDEYINLLDRNKEIFVNKWGFDCLDFNYSDDVLIEMIEADKKKNPAVLEIGCGMGTNLVKIRKKFPDAYAAGMESNEKLVRIAGKTRNISLADFEKCDFSATEDRFDCILLGEITSKVSDIDKLINNLKPLLAPDGCFIMGFSNVMHASVLLPLIKGSFDYSKRGIVRDNVRRFYTLKSVIEIMHRCGLKIDRLEGIRMDEDVLEKEAALWNYLKDGLGDDFEQQSITNRFMIKASPQNGKMA